MSSIPEAPENFSLEDNIARYAPKGDVSLDEAVELISGVINLCRDQKIEGLLLDVRDLYGFPNPSVSDRYWFIRKWAAESAGEIVLSMISRPEMIDPEQIGITIAANAGLIAGVFDNEDDARKWLAANVVAHSPA